MSSTPFEMIVSVSPGDIDEQNHVNNTVYLRWVQEVATGHWRAVASREARESIGWVVLRHEIDYKAPASLNDEIVLRTWVGQSDPAYLRTVHGNSAELRWAAIVESSDALVSDQCANGPSCPRVGRSARAVFDVSFRRPAITES